MAYAKKTWLQRIVSLPGRRRLTSTGTEDVYDMSRAEGEIIQEGDAWSAANMNDLEDRIDAGLDEKLDVTKVVEDINVTEEGYALGAKTGGEAIAALNDRLTWKFYGNIAGNVDTQYSAINNNIWNELFIQVQYSGVYVGFYFPRTTIVGQGSKHWHGGSYFSTTVNVGAHVWTGNNEFNLGSFQLNGTAVPDKSKVGLTVYYK